MKSISDLLSAWPLLTTSLLVAVALLAALITSIDLGTRFRVEWMGAYFIGVAVSMVTSVLVSWRDLSRGANLPFQPDRSDIGHGITLLCLAIAAERAFRFLLRREYQESRGNALLGALLAYILSVNVVSSLLGKPGGLHQHMFSAALVLLAVFAYAQSQPRRCIVIVRNTMLAFLLVSLLSLLVRPELVVDANYRDGILPGFTVRFYGFASHANNLAPLCLLLMCCLRLQRYDWVALDLLAWLIALSSIALTQSKTSIVLVLMALGYFWFLDQRQKVRDIGPKERRGWQAATLTSAVMCMALIGMLVLALQIGGGDFFAKLDTLDSREQLYTFTGRKTIWVETLRIVQESPLFGYGPGLWGLEMRIKTGLLFAAHAHNQFIHTLGAAGIVGLVALLFCLGALAVAAWRVRDTTRGVSLVLFMFLVLRGATEVPLSVANPMQIESLFQMVLLVICVGGLSVRWSPRPQVAAPNAAHFQPAPAEPEPNGHGPQ